MRKPILKVSLFGLVLLMIPAPRSMAIDIVISADPTETGRGRGLKARFHNVATVDGVSVDLVGKILSQTTNNTNQFRQLGDDFKFLLQDGEPGEVRSATVRWTFYESGTSNPVSFEDLALTIDDLDDFAGRTESIETEDAVSYTVNDPTNVVVSFVNGTLSATGSARQNTGDPESAVKMFIESGSSFVITYTSPFYSEGDAGFIHDGDGDFVFSNPAVGLFYTYFFTNNEEEPVTIDFSDGLPDGLT